MKGSKAMCFALGFLSGRMSTILELSSITVHNDHENEVFKMTPTINTSADTQKPIAAEKSFKVGHTNNTSNSSLREPSITQNASMADPTILIIDSTQKPVKSERPSVVGNNVKIGAFDKIVHETYKKATMIPIETNREKITLQGWLRTTGGLADEDRLLISDIFYNSTSVFEYGLGESTKIAAHTGVPRYAGVDSDAVYVGTARNETNMPHFRFFFADIGETREWGYAKNEDLNKIAYNYQVAPLELEKAAFDFYLVDGRYRVACACLCFLHAMKYGADMSKVRVAIHDNNFNEERGYDRFMVIGEIVQKTNRLWVYTMKKGKTEDDVYRMWRAHTENVQY